MLLKKKGWKETHRNINCGFLWAVGLRGHSLIRSTGDAFFILCFELSELPKNEHVLMA